MTRLPAFRRLLRLGALLCVHGSTVLLTTATPAAQTTSRASWPILDAPDYEVRQLTADGTFSGNAEGPEFTRSGRLFVVNCERDGTICEVHPDGRTEVVVSLRDGSNANAIREDADGTLLLADWVNHNVLRLNVTTRVVTVHAHDTRFHQPNDLARRRDGTLFASDPSWKTGRGRLWRVEPDGRPHIALDDLGTTNGIELSPDERTLYVAESVQRTITAYDVAASGALSNPRLLITFPDFGMDGIKTDADGRLYVTRHGKGTIAVVSPAGQVEREFAVTGKSVSNLVFGGPDGRTLFVTLQDRKAMDHVRVPVKGRGW